MAYLSQVGVKKCKYGKFFRKVRVWKKTPVIEKSLSSAEIERKEAVKGLKADFLKSQENNSQVQVVSGGDAGFVLQKENMEDEMEDEEDFRLGLENEIDILEKAKKNTQFFIDNSEGNIENHLERIRNIEREIKYKTEKLKEGIDKYN